MFVRAHEAMPAGGTDNDKEFFKRMAQTSLEFSDGEERIIKIDDNPDMLADVKGDMSKAII